MGSAWMDPGLWPPRQRRAALAAWTLLWAVGWAVVSAVVPAVSGPNGLFSWSLTKPPPAPAPSTGSPEPEDHQRSMPVNRDDEVLAPAVNIHDVWQRLADTARSHGLRLERFAPERAAAGSLRSSVQVQVQVQVLGPYRGLSSWLSSLAWGAPSIQAERIRLTPLEAAGVGSSNGDAGSARSRFNAGVDGDTPLLRLEVLLTLHPAVSWPTSPEGTHHEAAVGGRAARDPVRDPFDPARLDESFAAERKPQGIERVARGPVSALQRPLSHLTLVGTLDAKGQRVALIEAGGEVHEVREGDALGPERRPVRRVQVDAVELQGAAPASAPVSGAGRSLRSGWLIMMREMGP